ncbi:MAG: DUF4375 domain-containing protein [Planctomycetota bacterium]
MKQHTSFLLLCGLVVVGGWALRDRGIRRDPNADVGALSFGDYTVPFYDAWRHKHEVYPYECWTDEGYDPSLSEVPRDIQLLCCMNYGKSDIENGGFHQFFYNSTGVFAPEMIEWCERAGLNDVADVIREAMAVLTDGAYPRSKRQRMHALERFAYPGNLLARDPFDRINTRFFALLSHNGSRYDDAANTWLVETCGIAHLEDPPVKRKQEE